MHITTNLIQLAIKSVQDSYDILFVSCLELNLNVLLRRPCIFLKTVDLRLDMHFTGASSSCFFWKEETREKTPERKEGGNQGNQKEETRDCSRANVQTLCYQTRSSAIYNSVVLTIINYSPCFGVGFSLSRLIEGGSPLCGTI